MDINMLKIEEVIKGIKQWEKAKKIEFEPLKGGYTNVTYKVNVDNNTYALRINGNQNGFLKLKREEEIKAIEQAYLFNFAPKVLDCENKSDYLVTEFQSGSILDKEDIHNPEMIKRVSETLIKVHSIENIERKCSPYYLIHNYLRGAKEIGVDIPSELNGYLKRIDDIEMNRSKDIINTTKYCHNDYFTFNIIKNNDGELKVIDWELSGIGDIYFDLATLSFSNSFNEEEDEILLRSYFGSFDNEKQSILSDMKFVCMIREVAWALLHTGMDVEKVNHDMDYYKFALWVLDRLSQGVVML